MGLFHQLAGQVLGSLTGGAQAGDDQFLKIAMTLLQSQGGIEGLLAKLKAGGLGAQVASWVGTGSNLPVDANQIASALGQGTLSELAGKFGMDNAQVSQILAQVLPQLVDSATPEGSTEGADALLGQGLAVLGNLFNKP